MKRVIAVLLSVCAAISLVSCKPADNSGSGEKLVWIVSDPYFSDETDKPTFAAIPKNHPEYRKYAALEDLFKQKGIQADIEFKMLIMPEQPNGGEKLSEAEGLEAVLDNGSQADIISYNGVRLSYLADLTDYFSTDSGKKVRAAVSGNVWEAIGSEPYFIPKIKTLQGRRGGYSADKALMKKCGVSENDLQKSLADLMPVFSSVKSSEFSCYQIGAQMYSSVVFPRFTPIDSSFVFPFLAVDKNKTNGLVENVYENQECIEQMKMLLDWKNQKIIGDSAKESLIIDSYYTENERESDSKILIPIGEAYAESDVRRKSLAVCKKSKHMQTALEVIAMTVLDSEVSMAVNPYQVNTAGTESELKKYDSLGFYPNFEPIRKEYEACVETVRGRMQEQYYNANEKLPNYGDVWSGEMADLNAGITELNGELKKVGIDKVISELNAQLAEFYNKKAGVNMELKIENLNKYYGKKHVLKNFSVSLTDGVYGLLGPNGAGKSTLMNIITDNAGFDSGSIKFDGEDIFKLGKNFRKILGYMPQQQCLYESFTAFRFLSYIAALKGMDASYAKERIDFLLDKVNLTEAKNKRLSSFSGGMKQRVMIAQTFLDDPKVVIMDEPTAGLDPKERIRIRNLISDMSKNKIVIIATHVVPDVEFISKRILMVKDGELLYNERPAGLQSMLRGKVFEIKVSEQRAERVTDEFSVSNIYRDNEDVIVRVISESSPDGYTYSEVKPSLEDVYLYVFKEDIVGRR